MITIDESDAPEGYRAVANPNYTCDGCAFLIRWPPYGDMCSHSTTDPSCEEYKRGDGRNVVFVLKDPEE